MGLTAICIHYYVHGAEAVTLTRRKVSVTPSPVTQIETEKNDEHNYHDHHTTHHPHHTATVDMVTMEEKSEEHHV